LKSRHVQLISIGGVIGTGLFLGTANALRHGGPLGLLMGFAALGSVCYAVMVSLGEMIAHLPVSGGHITLAHRFVDPAFSFAMGYNYWYNWTIVLPAELNAAAVLIGYWSDVNAGVWITVCLVVAVAINLGGTKAYGECEFWFAIIKVITIVGLILLGIILDAKPDANGDRIGFRYWRNPGPFVQYMDVPGSLGRFLGFWAVLIQAAFSFIGTEIVAIAAGEAKNPKKNLPKAIKRVYIRIIVFYILGTLIIGLLVASNDPRLNLGTNDAASSPFVIAIQNAGIPALPSIINAALLTSAWSAASSDLYTGSRALYGLALNGNAPKILRRVNSWGLPYLCVAVGAAFALLSYMSVGAASAGKVFGYFSNMTSVCGLITWAAIAFTYIRFHKAAKIQGLDRRTLPYRAPLQPFLAYYALVFCIIILFFNGFAVFIHDGSEGPYVFDKSTFITSYFPIVFFPVLYFGFRVFGKSEVVDLSIADLQTGSRVEEERDEEEKTPKNAVQKFWAWCVSRALASLKM
ncbi:amino acid permease, partial [Leucosporidium creatinivorum]